MAFFICCWGRKGRTGEWKGFRVKWWAVGVLVKLALFYKSGASEARVFKHGVQAVLSILYTVQQHTEVCARVLTVVQVHEHVNIDNCRMTNLQNGFYIQTEA